MRRLLEVNQDKRRFVKIMFKKTVKLLLPEGYCSADVLDFEEADRKTLYNIYRNWRSLCDDLAKLGKSRAVNLPEALSEGAFCLETGAVRIISDIQGAAGSFDCYSLESNERIQVKACSVIPDLTSFGPTSVWDRLYFVDFYRNGNWDGTFDIYLIDDDDIYNQEVKANETFQDQQKQGRRPRFSVYNKIIQPKGLSPIRTGNLKV